MSDAIEAKYQELVVLQELKSASSGLADRLEGMVDRIRAMKETSQVSADVLGRWKELFRVAGLRESLELVLVKSMAAYYQRDAIRQAALSSTAAAGGGGGEGKAADASTAGSGPKAVGERPAKRRR